ncbi:MAG: flavodoxin family protein [Clostridiales bacterium]|mgnify:CR=1 FL=1|nr:flavodoxin family protein [Clostridiales bacterium]
MKIAIVYFSQSGNTEKAAGFIKEGLLGAGEFDIKLMNISGETSLDTGFLNECAAVIIGTPVYMADMAWQLKKWFDTDHSVKLAGKLGGAFATAGFVQGGMDTAVANVLHHMLVKGMLVYSSGTASGMPFLHLGPVAVAAELDNSRELFVTFGKRFADKAKELFD